MFRILARPNIRQKELNKWLRNTELWPNIYFTPYMCLFAYPCQCFEVVLKSKLAYPLWHIHEVVFILKCPKFAVVIIQKLRNWIAFYLFIFNSSKDFSGNGFEVGVLSRFSGDIQAEKCRYEMWNGL